MFFLLNMCNIEKVDKRLLESFIYNLLFFLNC